MVGMDMGKQDTRAEWRKWAAACMSSICTQVLSPSSIRFLAAFNLKCTKALLYRPESLPPPRRIPHFCFHGIPISGLLLVLDVLAVALFSGLLLLAAFLQRLRFVLLRHRS